MGPEAIRETLLEEGLSPPAVEYAVKQLSQGSNINDPLRYARKIAETYKPPASPMGCNACRGGWLINTDTDDILFTKTYRGSVRVSATDPSLGTEIRDIETDFVRPCRNCRPAHHGGDAA